MLCIVFASTDISASEVSKYAQNFQTTCSCVIKVVEPHVGATIDDLKAAVTKVSYLENDEAIPRWDDEHIPEEIVSEKPNPG